MTAELRLLMGYSRAYLWLKYSAKKGLKLILIASALNSAFN
jgi:hypothetical protein